MAAVFWTITGKCVIVTSLHMCFLPSIVKSSVIILVCLNVLDLSLFTVVFLSKVGHDDGSPFEKNCSFYYSACCLA